MKYHDTNKAIRRATECRYIPGEESGRRHSRRKGLALEREDRLESFCDKHGLVLTIANNGHHWKMEGETLLVEWWPSSAKLVFNKDYPHGIHVHEVAQVVAEIKVMLTSKRWPPW